MIPLVRVTEESKTWEHVSISQNQKPPRDVLKWCVSFISLRQRDTLPEKLTMLNYWCILSYFWFLMSPPTLSRWNMYKNIRMVWLLAIPFQCHLIWWIFVMRLEYLQWAHGCQNNIFLFSVNHKQDKALNAISLCFFFSVLGREWGLACTWDDRRILTTKSVQRVFLGNVKKT